MNTTIKIHETTRNKLRLLAALLGKRMVEVLDNLVSDALAKAQNQKEE